MTTPCLSIDPGPTPGTPFSLVTRPNIGKGYGNVYLLATTPGYTQTIHPDSTIKFNSFSKLATMSWKTADTITMLKSGLFQIDFQLSYVTSSENNIQIGLFINDQNIVVFGNSIPVDNGIGTVNGITVLKLHANDTIQFVGLENTFIIKPIGQEPEIIASVTITEV
jgi:hypothetical protein